MPAVPKSMPKKTFKDALAQPVPSRRVSLLASEEDRQKQYAAWAAEDLGKLSSLCDHYGIAPGPNQYMFLALELAREFVPGLQEQKRKGRPTKWTTVTKSILVVEVRRLIAETSRGPTSACKTLAAKQPWSLFVDEKDAERTLGTDPAEALRQIYQSFKDDSFCRIAWKAFRHYEITDTMPEWDQFVAATLQEARDGE
jgi:hypothetical protein